MAKLFCPTSFLAFWLNKAQACFLYWQLTFRDVLKNYKQRQQQQHWQQETKQCIVWTLYARHRRRAKKRAGAVGSRAYLAHLMARLQRPSMRSGREWLLPVLLSLPANTIGSMPPSSSGRATYTHIDMLNLALVMVVMSQVCPGQDSTSGVCELSQETLHEPPGNPRYNSKLRLMQCLESVLYCLVPSSLLPLDTDLHNMELNQCPTASCSFTCFVLGFLASITSLVCTTWSCTNDCMACFLHLGIMQESGVTS